MYQNPDSCSFRFKMKIIINTWDKHLSCMNVILYLFICVFYEWIVIRWYLLSHPHVRALVAHISLMFFMCCPAAIKLLLMILLHIFFLYYNHLQAFTHCEKLFGWIILMLAGISSISFFRSNTPVYCQAVCAKRKGMWIRWPKGKNIYVYFITGHTTF